MSAQKAPAPGGAQFSVVLPVLNGEQHIERCLRSILGQEITPQLIVIDGGSTDGTLDILARHAGDIDYLESGQDSGIADAFNRGIARAGGEWIAILNSDDWWEPDTLAAFRRAIEADATPRVLHGTCRIHGAHGAYLKHPDLSAMPKYMSLYHPTMLVHRSLYAGLGTYDAAYANAMDSEWVHRAMAAGTAFQALPEVLANMSLGGQSDRHFRISLSEYRRSVLRHGIAGRATADSFFLLHLLVKYAYHLPGFYHCKRWLDQRFNRSVTYGQDVPGELPTISIVTPSLNQAEFVERSVRSVLAQDYAKLEYLVCDGASTDGTVEILGGIDDDRLRVVCEPDEGQADAIDRGFARTSGEIVAWLNSDDVLLPGTLDFVGRYFRDHPDVDAIYGHRVFIDASDAVTGHWILPPHSDYLQSRWDHIPQETCFWRRSLMSGAGGVDPHLQFAVDFDLFQRMMQRGKFRRVNRLLAAFRVHPGAKTTRLMATVGGVEIERIRSRQRMPPGPVAFFLEHAYGQLIRKSGRVYSWFNSRG